VTKVDTDLYAANLNEKALDINIQIAALAVFTAGGLVTLVFGVYLARYAAIAAEVEKPKEDSLNAETEGALINNTEDDDGHAKVHPVTVDELKEKSIRRASQLTSKKSFELVSLPPLPLKKIK